MPRDVSGASSNGGLIVCTSPKVVLPSVAASFEGCSYIGVRDWVGFRV